MTNAEGGGPVRAGAASRRCRSLLRGMPREVLRKLLGEPDASTAMGDEYDFGRSQVGVTFERDVIEYDPLVRVMSFALRRR